MLDADSCTVSACEHTYSSGEHQLLPQLISLIFTRVTTPHLQ